MQSSSLFKVAALAALLLAALGHAGSLRVTGSGVVRVTGSGALRAAGVAPVWLATASGGASNAQTVALTGVDSSGAGIGVVCAASSGDLNIADNKSGTWTEIDNQGTSVFARLYKATNLTWGSNTVVTIGLSGTTRTPSAVVGFISGVTASGTPAKSSASATVLQAGSITPGNATNVAIACLTSGAAITAAITEGFTIAAQVPYVDGQYLGSALAYKVQSAATAFNPEWSWSGTVAARAINVSLVP